jgi:adenosylmethionine---8-amino-7-oxononanoate aminotransferase
VTDPGDLRARIVELDKRHVWHPYTPMGQYIAEADPLVVARAHGSLLFDLDGRSYIDGNASWWTAVVGHQHPRLVAAIRAQSETLCHTSLAGVTHEAAALLAAELCAVAPPGLGRVFYSDDGSTAVEVAIKLALQFWRQNGHPERTRFVALDGAFHGETLGVTALGGVEVFRRPFASVLMDCIHVPAASDGHDRAFAALSRVVEEGASEIAAIVLEPLVQGAAGMRIYDAEYLRGARELASRHDVLLVLDEVFTGYGRTGPMWATQQAGVSPDILCTAKGFTGGVLPMAATLANERVFEGFLGDKARALHHGHTFCGNPLGAAVAREVLRIFQDERILEHARPKAERIADAFRSLRELPGVRATRSLGMIGALDLEGGEGYLADAGWRVNAEALRRGAVLRPLGNVVYVTPALNIEDVQLEQLLSVVAESVRAAMAGWG